MGRSNRQPPIIRDGRPRNITVTIGRLSDKEPESGPTQNTEEIGLTVRAITPQLAEQFGVDEDAGVIVTGVTPGSITAQAGIRSGSIILQVDRKPVRTEAEFKQAVDASTEDKQLLLLVRRCDFQQYIVINW